MGNALDFEKLRRRRQRAATLKRLLILVGVMLLVGMAIFLNEILVQESATVSLGDLWESFGGTGFPTDLPGGVISSVNNIGKNLTVLNDTNLYIYSPKAKTISNIQRMSDQTIAIPSDSRVLTFAVGNKNFSVHSLSKELFSKTLEYGVLCGDMNAQGDFAVVAPVKQFASKVYVYNRRFEEMYSWSSPEYVTNVSLSPKGDMMAINCISGDGGQLESLIYMFRFSEDREKAEIAQQLSDNLCLDVNFAETERVMVLTDKQYLLLNSIGEQKASYDFAGKQLMAVETYEKNTLFLLQEREGKDRQLVILDANLVEKAKVPMETAVQDMAIGRDAVYILTEDGISIYDFNLALKSSFKLRNISNIHLIGSKLYYLTPNEICVLG